MFLNCLPDRSHLEKETTTLHVRMKADGKETVEVDDYGYAESVIALTNR